MIPGPRPRTAPNRPPVGRDPGPEVPLLPQPETGAAAGCGRLPVTLTRTGKGWMVVSPAGAEAAGGLVEGLSLADLVAEETGCAIEPDRTARRSARGPGQEGGPGDDSPEGRIAALQRTVAQLEHALAARVATERAIGVLAERNRTSTRAAFEWLRREARSSERPVAELARLVLDSLQPLEPVPGAPAPPPTGAAVVASAESPVPAAAADGRP